MLGFRAHWLSQPYTALSTVVLRIVRLCPLNRYEALANALVSRHRLGLVLCLCNEVPVSVRQCHDPNVHTTSHVLHEALLLLTRSANWWSLGFVCWAASQEVACCRECSSECDEGELRSPFVSMCWNTVKSERNRDDSLLAEDSFKSPQCDAGVEELDVSSWVAVHIPRASRLACRQ